MIKASYIIKLESKYKKYIMENYHTKEETTKMIKQGKEERGITLIALVITIVLNSCRCGRKEICIT